jgi:predicted dehydrogenase
MADITRRSFLEHSLMVATAGLAAARVAEGATTNNPTTRPTTQPTGRVAPAERIGIAVIGLNGRGENHVEAYTYDDGVEVVALCDVDERTFGKAQAKLQERGRPQAKMYTDIRKLLEDKDVQAVSIATPNHWHALAGIWAMQAGRDVYVEKPVSHTVVEGRRLEQARLKYNRICQAGTQSRSSPACQEAIKYIRDGHIGKVLLSRGLCYKQRNSIGHYADSSPPPGVHYDLWLGPAPVRPFNKNRFHYEWHWNWDYGNGDIGNQGIHQMDIARWALGKGLPNAVVSLGGRFGYVDDGQTPNTQLALFDYGDSSLLFEVRGLKSSPLMGVGTGNIVYGSEGFVAFTADYGNAVAFDNEGKKIRTFKGDSSHFGNFIKAVRSRKQSDLNAPVVECHLSSALCHLANISYQLGREHPFSVRNVRFDNADLYEAFGRMEQHLADSTFAAAPVKEVVSAQKGVEVASADETAAPTTRPADAKEPGSKKGKGGKPKSEGPPLLKLQEMAYQLGPVLKFDPKTERFVGNDKANQLSTRQYRAPFVVPDHV